MFQEELAFAVVDAVLEEVRLGMEINTANMAQRRIATVKFLGEVRRASATTPGRAKLLLQRPHHSLNTLQLYNFTLVDSHVIFSALYSLITFAAHHPKLDPPTNCFRYCTRASCSIGRGSAAC